MKSILKEKYNKEVVKGFQKKFGVKSVVAVPKISKTVINVGIGKYLKEKEAVDKIFESLKEIAGQKPIFTKAKKSISGFKVRQGQEIGVAVTLRGKRMWHFLERLINSALPRVRDFQGIDGKCFDNQGNLSFTVKEHIVFPEIAAERVKNIFSFQVTVVISAKNKDEGREFFKMLGFPIKSE